MLTTIKVQYDSDNAFMVHAIEVLKGLGAKISYLKNKTAKKYKNTPIEVDPADMVAETWEEYGLSKESAESCAESMKEYSKGEYTVCKSKEDLEQFLDSL